MDPKTLAYIVYLEQLAALVAKGIVDIKNLISGSGGVTADQLLDDADATYNQIIQNAQQPPSAPSK